MTRSITLLRAVVLGAFLCIGAALARDLGPTVSLVISSSNPEQDMPFEGQPGGLESADLGTDDADGFEDALLHPQLARWSRIPVCACALTSHEERPRTRAEDRRREKPPRALHV